MLLGFGIRFGDLYEREGLLRVDAAFLALFEPAFLFALLCLVLGCGMFKGNIASQVGSLYKPEDLRRADAFQMGLLATLQSLAFLLISLPAGASASGSRWLPFPENVASGA